MFVYSIIIAIALGFILRGNLKNLGNVKLDGLYLVFVGFAIDAAMQLLGRYNLLKINNITFVADVFMYVLIFVFVYKNKKNICALLLGLGSLLNAIAIFSNGGAMPVRQSAMNEIVKNFNPTRGGLYVTMHSGSHFKPLCDIMYVKIMGPFIFSVGDLVMALGMMLIIVIGMKSTSTNSKRISTREKRYRRSKRFEKQIKAQYGEPI